MPVKTDIQRPLAKSGSKYSPRAGFAYLLDSNTVIRGGAGVFYAPLVYSTSPAFAPGYVVTNSIPGQSGLPTVSLGNPFPNIQTQGVGNSNGLSQNIGTSFSIIDQNRHAPIDESYSFSVERQSRSVWL